MGDPVRVPDRHAARPVGRRLLIVTGESSGDAHAAGVVDHARRMVPGLTVAAVGGRHLAAVGAELLHDHRDLSVVGISEVLARLPALRHVQLRDARIETLAGLPAGARLPWPRRPAISGARQGWPPPA